MEGFNPEQPDSRAGFEFFPRSNARAYRACVLPMPFLACFCSVLFFFLTAEEGREVIGSVQG